MRKAALVVVCVAFGTGNLWAQNPRMSDDYQRMMGWLTNEVVQGLAFNSGSTFDPPNELKPWKMQPDVSFGIGFIPLNKKKFPVIETPALAEKNPWDQLPNQVTIPNLTLHLRMGMPRRVDASIRVANMTVPKGYKISNTTQGDGQSNTIGFAVRKHLLGGGRLLLSLSANFNHVFGHFNFQNEYKNFELTQGFLVDSVNRGRLQWNVNSIGANAVLSRTYRIWTPFIGMGYSHMSGSVLARLQSDYATMLISPSIGEASDKPEEHQARVIFGAQMDRARLSFFINGEMKAIGASSGKTFIVSMGIVAPFRIGAMSVSDRNDGKAQRRLAMDRSSEKGSESGPVASEPLGLPRKMSEKVVPFGVRTRTSPVRNSREAALPEMILIR